MVILQLDQQPYLIQAIFSGELDEVQSALEIKPDANILDCEKRSPLHAASFKGDVEIAALLLSHGARVNTKDNRWITPLHRACCCGSPDLVSLLLKHQADTTARDKHWQTPLHVAAANNAVECIAQLLDCVPNPNVTDRTGRTALHHAVVNGHNEVVELLLTKGSIVNACDKKDCRPLHCAAHMGHIDTIEVLLRNGADINAKDRNQYSPLHVAAASGMVSACRALLRSGAEIDARNAYGNTPLHIACLNGHVPVCNVLISFNADPEAVNYRGQTPLHIAAASTHGVDCLNFLIDHKVNINKQSLDGRSPLHMTAIHGRFTRSKTLIDRGAIVDCVDKNGCTALHIAAQYGHDLLSNTLLTYGADPLKRGYAGRTPLHMSCLSGYVECCRKFLQAGVDLNAQDDSGKTAIHCAAYKGSVECLDLLVSNGANFHLLDKIGRTPLHYASVQGHYPCVFTLVGLGSSVNLCDAEGCSPLHLAAAYDVKGECVEYLLRHKADPKLKDKKGFTPIHYAVAGENFAGLGFLLSAVGNNYLMFGSDMPLTTPLHLAARSGNQDILRLLLSYFHDTNIRTEQGSTALLLAAKSGHTHCVQMLLRFGAKVGITDGVYCMSPVHYSARNGHMHCLALLLDNTEDKRVIDLTDSLQRTPLMLAVAGGHTESALTLLKCGADPNILDADKHSSLFRAVVNGQHSTVQLLISHGAVISNPDVHGKTVLHLAAACGHLSSLQTILKTMDPPDAIALDNQECTALHWACYNGNPNCVSFLLEREIFKELTGNVFSPVHCATFVGAERCIDLICTYFGTETIKLKDARNRTPLHIAALHGHVDCAKYLLEKGAEIECKDADGRTPLVAAAQNGQSQIIELLISYKADMTSYDNNGNTALHLACLKRHSHAALLLLENIDDADIVNMINNDRKTPLHLSARNGLVNVTRQLISKGSSVLAIDANGMTPALCCAPNSSVAQCLALILANYAICSQQNNTKDQSAFSLCPYPQNMCLLFRNKLSKKIKSYCAKISQTDLSLLRDPDYFEHHRMSRRHHNSPNLSKRRSAESKFKSPLIPKCSSSWKMVLGEQRPVQDGLKTNPFNVTQQFWRSQTSKNSNDCFIVENFKCEDQSKQSLSEKCIGLDLHRSYSDMFIAHEINSDTEIKNVKLDSKLKKNIKILDSKLRGRHSRVLQNQIGIDKRKSQYDWPMGILDINKTNKDMNSNTSEKILKEIIHQLIGSYGPNINIDQLLHLLIQTVHKLKVSQSISSNFTAIEQNKQIDQTPANPLRWLDEFENDELNQLLAETMNKIHEQEVNSILASYESFPHQKQEQMKPNIVREDKKPLKTFAKQTSKNPKSAIRLQQKKGTLDIQSPKVDKTGEEVNEAGAESNSANGIEKTDIVNILNRANLNRNSVQEIYQSNMPLELEHMAYTYKPKLKILDSDDDVIMNVDQVLKEEQLWEEEELEKLCNFQKRLTSNKTTSWTDSDIQLRENPEYIIMKGLEIIKSAKHVNCISPHLQMLNVLLAKWPNYMSQTAEIMKHIIAAIQEHSWLEKVRSELTESKEKLHENNLGVMDADLFALECSEDIHKTAKQLLTKITNLQKGVTIEEQTKKHDNSKQDVIDKGIARSFTDIYSIKKEDFLSKTALKKDSSYHFTKNTFQSQSSKCDSKESLKKLQMQEVPFKCSSEVYCKTKDQNLCHGDLSSKRKSLTMFHMQPMEITATPSLISICVQTSFEKDILSDSKSSQVCSLAQNIPLDRSVEKPSSSTKENHLNENEEIEICNEQEKENKEEKNENSFGSCQQNVQIEEEQDSINTEEQNYSTIENQMENLPFESEIKEELNTIPSDVISGTISLVPYLSVQKEMEITLGAFSGNTNGNIDANESQSEEQTNAKDKKRQTSIETLYINKNQDEDSLLEEEAILLEQHIHGSSSTIEEQEIEEVTQTDDCKRDQMSETENSLSNYAFELIDHEKDSKPGKKQLHSNVSKKKLKHKDGSHCVIC